MANTIGYGQGAINNTNAWGQGAKVGSSSFSNLQSTEYDGIDAYVDCGNGASLQITGSLTISAWVKTTNTSTNGIIVGKDGVSTGTRSYQIQHLSTGEARIVIFTSGGVNLIDSTTLVNDGNWHHVMGVNDGTDLKIYVDGTLEGTNVGGGGTILNGTSYFAIGRREANAPQNILWFSGNIDEVAVWDSDQSSIASAIGSSPVDLSSYSPVSWWRFEGTGTTATDSGSGGNNGVLDNTVVRSTDVPT